MMLYNTNVHLVNVNVYTKFGLKILNENLIRMECRADRVNPVYPVFQSGVYKKFEKKKNSLDINFSGWLPNEPRCEKTGLRGFRPGPTQTGLYNHRR